jgi:hypothetical protein
LLWISHQKIMAGHATSENRGKKNTFFIEISSTLTMFDDMRTKRSVIE